MINVVYYRGKKVYEPPKYMTISTAIEQLLEVEEMRKQSGMLLDAIVWLWVLNLLLLSKLVHIYSKTA